MYCSNDDITVATAAYFNAFNTALLLSQRGDHADVLLSQCSCRRAARMEREKSVVEEGGAASIDGGREDGSSVRPWRQRRWVA
ncbi:hypothetical protein ACLOJK_024095, partial [Asimina triloba]